MVNVVNIRLLDALVFAQKLLDVLVFLIQSLNVSVNLPKVLLELFDFVIQNDIVLNQSFLHINKVLDCF